MTLTYCLGNNASFFGQAIDERMCAVLGSSLIEAAKNE